MGLCQLLPEEEFICNRGYLIYSRSIPLCYLCAFYTTNYECEAQTLALEESLESLLEEVECSNNEVEFKIKDTNIIA